MHSERFAYFMVRVRHARSRTPGDALAGVVEQLATGEKRSFETGEELLRAVADWPGAVRNLPVAQAESQENHDPHTGSV